MLLEDGWTGLSENVVDAYYTAVYGNIKHSLYGGIRQYQTLHYTAVYGNIKGTTPRRSPATGAAPWRGPSCAVRGAL